MVIYNYEPFWNINNGKTLCKKCHYSKKKETLNILYDKPKKEKL